MWLDSVLKSESVYVTILINCPSFQSRSKQNLITLFSQAASVCVRVRVCVCAHLCMKVSESV